MISVSAETQSDLHLQEIKSHNINLIQFDRYLDSVRGYRVINDNSEAAYKAVKLLISQGYKRIGFIGGPPHISIFKQRKEGYIRAVKEAGLSMPRHFIAENSLVANAAEKVARDLLVLKDPPDAFLTVSDHQSLEVLKAAVSLGINVPEQLGIFGFANEAFTELITPALSSINQKSKEIGKCSANIYFDTILPGNEKPGVSKKHIIKGEIILRESSLKGVKGTK